MSDRIFSFVLFTGALLATSLAACDGVLDDKSGDGLSREELGTFTTDTGFGIDVPFNVPADTVSALVYCGPYGYDRLATAESVTAPDGGSVYDMDDPTATAMRVDVHSDVLPVLIPVSPDLDITSGAYGLRAYFDTESAVSATCFGTYRVDGVSGAPSVDLRLVFVGAEAVAPGLTAAEGETTLEGVLGTLAAIWGGGGLSIGDVSYEDFGGDVATYSVVDGDAELGSLLRQVDSGGTRSLTFFFVQDITDDDGATILGLAGGPPGTAGADGTSKSGVVINATDFTTDPDEIARIMAHEGGHFMGLFHTTEKDGSQTDPLSDTPECSTDSDSNGTLSTAECGGKGAENVMWWASSGDAVDMSGDQGWVLARSLVVR